MRIRELLTTQEDIIKEANQFYKLFDDAKPLLHDVEKEWVTEVFAKRVDHADSLIMVNPITESEIKGMMWSMDNNYEPSLDGHTVEFFKNGWNVTTKSLLGL
ncbi:hypothetical protein LIER_35602 [Lithospermum erythrorhizon]|uniref:Uncharacterized protein n=1 Tax=Lithospermum erythrorhizon TaxID=34254 RepID=A0AAV3NW04_LITER